MKFLDCFKIRLVLIGFAAILLGGGSAIAGFTFGTPVEIPNVNCSVADAFPTVSANGLELIFVSDWPNGDLEGDLWVTTRATVDDDWDVPVKLGPTVNSSADESCPSLLADDLSLFFSSFMGTPRPGGHGQGDIWVTTRATASDPWGQPENIGPSVNTWNGEVSPFIWNDGRTLFFSSNRAGGAGGWDLWMTTRETADEDWVTPVPLENVNSNDHETAPAMSPDGLILLFQRGGVQSTVVLWMATRKKIDEPFGLPVQVPVPINYPGYHDCDPHFAADGSTLYFVSNRPGGSGNYDLWQAPIIPTVDLNGDGIVDAEDMCIVVDYWGTDEPSCDIGPMPWGDGTVDVQDLIVLSEHLFEEVNDPTLIVHWALDETEGMIVADSAGDNNGYALGDPIWKSDGGQVDGALQLDGVDDYVLTGFVLNPEEGPFSVLVWIKGGAPGQTVLSQMGGASWLCADASDGNLMTELKGSGGDPLLSSTVITDGKWHRIGLIWDGSNRTLCVDGVVVAEDTQDSLESSSNGLYIGTGKAMESGTYWSGLIDDVRIYNRAATP